jgi:protein-S-isoprenylcysteine O-methyltransferase Ste14
VQLLVTFGLWAPSHVVWWRAEGMALVASLALYAGSWLLLLWAMIEAGLDLQSGFRGWGAVVRNRVPRWKPFPTHGLHRHTRQPVYVAFFLTLWTGPVWTPDRLLLALVWAAYCVLGPRWKEGRILRFEDDRYRRYQAQVPYWLPRLRAARSLAERAAVPSSAAAARPPSRPLQDRRTPPSPGS